MLFMLAAMLGIVAANAQITQGRIGTGDITIAGYTTTDVYGLDFDNDGTNLEFRIADFPGSPNLTNGYLTYDWTDGGNNIVNETGVWDYMAILASGVTVGSTSEFEGQGDGAFNTTNLTAGVHYMGFRILLSDGVHYGWAEYTVAENGDDFDLTWTKCYYNATVGEAITTGDEGGSSCDVAAGDLPYSFGFETLDCWEEEVIAGSKHWEVTTYHYTAIQGTGYAIFGGAYSSEARLISPTFNVAGVPNLTLKFAHAQDAWGSDQDSLKVEYRLSPTDAWQTLATYKNSISSFEFASIPLTETSATLQIAFHAYSNYGYRVAIDSLTLTSVSCQSPVIADITVTENSATVTWSGSASQYGITLDDGDEEVVNGTSKTFTGLTANTSYSISLRAICGGEGSEVVSQTFRTLCGTEAFPYSENFESYTAGTGNFPECWTSVSGTNYVQSGSSYASQGTKALHMQGIGSTVVTPIINIGGNDAFISFDLKCEDVDKSGDMAIGVAASPASAESAEWLDTIDAATTYDRYEYIYHNTSSFASGCIVFKQMNTTYSNYYYWIDSLTVTEPPACAKPINLTLNEATNNSLTLSWTENGSASMWVVKVGDGAWTEVRDNPYEITGLAANTDYVVSVRAFCDPDTSDAVSGTFRTLCDAEDFPYSENFESFTASNVPDCWTNIAGSTTVVENGYTTYSYEGTKALRISGGGVIASPVINVNRSDVYVNFELKRSYSSAGTLAVGIAASPALVNDAVYFDTIEPDNTNYNNYEYIFHNTLSLTSGCLIFKQLGSTSTYYYFYIDSLTVSQPPACAKPTNLEATVVTDNSLTLSWTEAGSASKWVVKVGDGAWTETTENPYTINGLDANTEYAVSVRAFCDPDTSDAVNGTFRTLCGFEAVPYSEDFEGISSGLPDCWEQEASNASRAKWDFTSSGHEGNGLNFNDWYAENSRLIMPVMNCSSLTADGQLSFYFKNPAISNGLFAHLVIYYRTSSTGEWTAIDSWTLTAANEDWTSADVILPSSANAPYYQVSFLATGENTSPRVYLYLDDITIGEAPACARPSNLAAEAAETSLTLSWVENGSATKWVVKVDDGAWTETTQNPYTINDLTANTEYAVSVRAFCDPDTSEAVSGTFRTLCGVFTSTDLPYFEGFEGDISCWEQENINGNTMWEVDGLYSYYDATAYEGAEYYGINGDGAETRLISPVFNLAGIDNVTLKLAHVQPSYYGYYQDNLTIEYRLSSTGEWQTLATYTDDITEWQSESFDIPNPGATFQFAFRAQLNDANGVGIDSVSLSTESTPQPTCDVPTALAAGNVTASSAVITWNGTAAQYEVELNGQSSTVNTNSYTAHGLTAATAYTVRVRALCDGGLTSDWTAVVNFTTLDEPQPMECNTPTGLAASNVTANSANISWNEVTIAETFDGEWNLAMGAEDSVHTMITPDATMHTLLTALGMDFEDVDENVSVAGTLVPVTIEPAAGNQMNVTGSFDMAMYGVDDPVTFHFSTTGTVTSTGMNIEPATINETVRIMNAMDIDYTGTLTFAQPTALPVDGTLTIGIASMNISGYGDTTVYMMTGSVSISMVGTNLTASGSRETTNAYPTYELVVTNVATGVETPITNATTPYALEGLTASTEYTVKVRTHCDENSTSDWSAAVSFTTLNGGGEDPTCDVPTNIVIDQESINTPYAALITWNGTASQYEIEITGGEQPVTTTVSTNSYTFNGVASTTYSVRVRAICDGGVTSDWSAAQSFTTPNGGEPQGIDDVNASYSVNIYPNPAKNTVTISVDGLSGKAQVSVIDMSGRTVMTSTMESDATQLNVSKLAQGTYFVRINGETISTVRKLVVK